MVRTNHPELNHAIDRDLEAHTGPDPSAEELYFANTKAPEYLQELELEVGHFVDSHINSGRNIAVVTSGGTTVPLENNTVRFIDNFSAGTRGSISAEYLLAHGYCVIFVHREFSLKPYSQHYSNQSILDLLELDASGQPKIKEEYQKRVAKDLILYEKAKSEKLLLEVPFTTVNQYLYTLRMISTKVQPFNERALFYLAAAVSDFFLPMSKLSEHKIQSKGMAKLVVDLDPVPKFLNTLAKSWTSGAMIVSFKLETDKELLLSKCHGALIKYGHQLVIGNLLQTRKDEIYLVGPNFEKHIVRPAENPIIENVFLPSVVKLHENYMSSQRNSSPTPN